MRDTTGIFTDYMAPVVRNTTDGVREIAMLRWEMPGPPASGGAPITNIRNTKSPHWRGWLKPANWVCKTIQRLDDHPRPPRRTS
jgi:putative SOS response-associated peptidase YedK